MRINAFPPSQIETMSARIQRTQAITASAAAQLDNQRANEFVQAQAIQAIEAQAYATGKQLAQDELNAHLSELNAQAKLDKTRYDMRERERTSQLNDALKQLRSTSLELTMQAEELAVELAFEALTALLGKNIQREEIKQLLIERALDSLTGNQTRIRAGSFFKDATPPHGVALNIDDALPATQLVIETPKGNLVSDLASRLHALSDGLIRELSI
jgi:DNA polymerase III alpha subunit (gram-positive type)